MMIMISGHRSDQLLLILFFVIFNLLLPEKSNGADVTILCKENERQALLDFKQSLLAGKPSEMGDLSSWENDECCHWEGVVCNNLTGYVEMLVFGGYVGVVAGTISPSLLKLRHLSHLNLRSNDFNGSLIPEFICSLKNLTYLDLSGANFRGPIPSQLGNLSMLETLRLGSNPPYLSAEDDWNFYHNSRNLFSVGKIEWLSHLSSLKNVNLSFINLSKASDWSQVINQLPLLTDLNLSDCGLPSVTSSSLSLVNSSASLKSLDLSGNNLTSSAIYPWLFNVSSNLVYLDLSSNQLKGPIPESFGSLIAMEELHLSDNQLEGEIFKSFGNMCRLGILHIEFNHLSSFGFVQNTSLCTSNSLNYLNLAWNQLKGNFVNDITKLPSISTLDLGYNLLNGAISESIGQLSSLSALKLAGNSFDNVVISEAHFSNLTNLITLDLSCTSLTLKFNVGWTPPFQLREIILCSCKLGPRFPDWLRTQTAVSALDISASEILDSLPYWFWDSFGGLAYLNLSFNQINGTLPNNSIEIRRLDLTSNYFSGPLPKVLSSFQSNLSKNKFTGSISSICNFINKGFLQLLDLSSNQFFGVVPDCLAEFLNLIALNLADNNLSGPVPSSLGSLASLEMLSLRGNKFSGGLPSSLQNCMELKFLDLSDNKLSGKLPMWIGQNLSSLVFLSLQKNQFNGKIPHPLCGLKHMQILELSVNKFSGTIPSCLNNFTSMAQKASLDRRIEQHLVPNDLILECSVDLNYVDEALLTWRGTKQMYAKILGLLLVIDLSCNKLSGDIPEELTSLQQLVALNLSRNFLTGKIPRKIGQLRQLQSLDLSRNKLSGSIPTSLSELTFLGSLDLSSNNLSGKIPTSTQLQSFDPSSFSHNQGLCGPPVSPNCSVVPPPGRDEEDSDDFRKWFYAGMGLGFAVGFWGFCSAVFFKRSWRHSYFRFLDNAKDWLYVSFVLLKARLGKKIKTLLSTSWRRTGN